MEAAVTGAGRAARRPSAAPLLLPLRLAFREMRAGIGGFAVFIACVALGVMVITAVGALSDALERGLGRQGQRLLGGDVVAARIHQRASASERAWLASQGRMSETATLRAMARRLDASDQSLVEIKGVDQAYPMVGAVELGEPGRTLAEALGPAGASGAVVDPILLARLDLAVGDRISLGGTTVEIRGTVKREPDALTDRLTFGPRVFVTTETLEKTGLARPGTLIRWRYALLLDAHAAAAGVAAGPVQATARQADTSQLGQFAENLRAALPEAGFTVRDRRDPSPQVTRTLERLRQFLTLLGLAALGVGGIGVANAVATFIDRRRQSIAVFKSLGAPRALVFQVFTAQVMLIALIGIAIGLAAGLAVPPLIASLVGQSLPVEIELGVRARSIAVAVGYGLIVALLFALWPLGRAGEIRAAVLFREEAVAKRGRPPWRILAALVVLVAMLTGLAVLTSGMAKVALGFVGGVMLVLALFAGLAVIVRWVARRLPRPRRPELAIALGNIGAAGGLTGSVILSLGAGLSLLVAVALVDRSLIAELTSRLPAESPSYFVLDIPKGDRDGFRAAVRAIAPAAHIDEAPMLRGRIVALKGTPAEAIRSRPEAQWVLRGDRGLTYADAVPDGSRVIEGTWWAADYEGPPLVSFEADIARQLGLGLGDEVTVNVLGRNITARIANLRQVDWESLAINFVMVFTPSALKGAPHNLLATITLPSALAATGGGTVLRPEAAERQAADDAATEAAIARALARGYPSVTPIRVKDAINAFTGVFEKVMIAIRTAGAVTLVAGALVLAGALATAQRRRIHQAVVLKVLGATRRRLLATHLIEYALLALVTAGLATLVGGVAAWIVVTYVMKLTFTWSWLAVAQALAAALGLVAVFGSIGTLSALRSRPVPVLRS